MVNGRKRNFGWLRWLLGVILVSTIVGVVIVVKVSHFDKGNGAEDSVEVSAKTSDTKAEIGEDGRLEGLEKKDVAQYDGATPNVTETLTGAITHAAVNGENLVIRVNIDQYLEDGMCVLSLKQAEENVYSDAANIIGSAATATCEGFDVPVGKLPNGTIEIIIDLNAGDKSGKITGRAQL